MKKSMNDLYNEMSKGMLKSSIKRDIAKAQKINDEKLYKSIENRVEIFINRFNELPE